MTATTELREAAELLTGPNLVQVPAWKLRAWLIEEADTLDLLNIEPTAALAVARCINEGTL